MQLQMQLQILDAVAGADGLRAAKEEMWYKIRRDVLLMRAAFVLCVLFWGRTPGELA